jgi:hypothetical protein
MDPKQQKSPEERVESVWTETGKNFKEDDQVMMITVSKETGKCDVLYLNAVSANEDIRLANRATFPVGTFVEEILDRKPPRRVNQTVFRDYQPGERRERELVPFTFDDDVMTNSPKRGSPSPVPLEEVERPTSPRKRDRQLRKSAKETDAERGGFLTAMGSEEGEKSSSSSTRKSNNKKKNIKRNVTIEEPHNTRPKDRRGEDSCLMPPTKEWWTKNGATQHEGPTKRSKKRTWLGETHRLERVRKKAPRSTI